MSLIRDVSVSELMGMRESGMSNKEIASALDISYQTVLRFIGKQPSSLRKQPEPRAIMEAPKPQPETPEACLIVEDRTVSLTGMFGSYRIPAQCKCVQVSSGEGSLSVPFEKIGEFIDELTAIRRNLDKLTLANEMW